MGFVATYSLNAARMLFPSTTMSQGFRLCNAGFMILIGSLAVAQKDYRTLQTFDTAYVRDYSHQLTMRLYSSTKYNAFFIASNSFNDLAYRPNNRINLGIGASYHSLTLNLGFGVPFLNGDDAVRGKTRYLDAQANIHTQRWATNLFLQVFGGYYISSHTLGQVGWQQDTEFPYRADLVQFNIGASTLRIMNDKRFSYRASFNQDAWQRRSQGSFLLGGYATYYSVHADSSLVPTRLIDQFDAHALMRRGNFVDIGPMGGYAYTFVVKEHWFLTVSGAVGAGLSVQHVISEIPEGEAHRTDVGPGWHAQIRSGMGYNSQKNYVGIAINQENIGYLLASQGSFRWNVGSVRLNFVHRFNQRLPLADRGIHWFRKKIAEPAGISP
ncbi:MAG TPA: DUF4421 domain-containing protein [Flavobacteriales bacterium]|nr:DUF4421 domain-containing protein [Flavobacteriales bacterium]